MVAGRRRAPRRHPLAVMASALVLLAAAGCGEESPPAGGAAAQAGAGEAAPRVYDLSEKGRAGEGLFNANCQACHGPGASGTDQGPTFISGIYHPGHHADFSFVNAMRNGVRAHHWRFGDMPPVAGLSDADVETIICYVREVQRANGLFDDEGYLAAC